MSVGGSKGSISGNYAMNECDLMIIIGARGVCQWDSSGTAFRKAKKILNINCDYEDLGQYNNSVRIQGDAEAVLLRLIELLKEKPGEASDPAWLRECAEKRAEWEAFKQLRYDHPVLIDKKRGRAILTEPAAIKKAVDFADAKGCVKIFDAGDVQANGFQIVTDEKPGQTITDSGSSYMGFAVSSMLAFALAGNLGTMHVYRVGELQEFLQYRRRKAGGAAARLHRDAGGISNCLRRRVKQTRVGADDPGRRRTGGKFQ